jgi:hypothetical protein
MHCIIALKPLPLHIADIDEERKLELYSDSNKIHIINIMLSSVEIKKGNI